MSWRSALWWLFYVVAAVALQASLPGLDLLLPGFLIALQERRHAATLIVAASFILLQEGMGSMAFGGSLLWYGITALLFVIGCRLFQGTSLLFISLLSVLLAVTHYAVFGMLATLQDIPWQMSHLLEECLWQAVVTPPLWQAAFSLRRKVIHETREQ